MTALNSWMWVGFGLQHLTQSLQIVVVEFFFLCNLIHVSLSGRGKGFLCWVLLPGGAYGEIYVRFGV
jgi:hypothetical protein